MILCSIYDSIAKEYSNPYIVKNIEVAKRDFSYQMRKNVICDFIKDYKLCIVGYYNPENGEITPSIEDVMFGSDIVIDDVKEVE